jgi:hypothetical protein
VAVLVKENRGLLVNAAVAGFPTLLREMFPQNQHYRWKQKFEFEMVCIAFCHLEARCEKD